MKRQGGRVLVAVVLVLMLVGSAVAALTWTPAWVAQLVYAAESGKAKAARQQLGVARDFSDAFEAVAEALRPAVVSVSSVTRVRPRDPRGQQMPEEFRRFFGEGDRFDFFQFGIPEGGFEQRGQGSGVIVSEDGYIVTNNHVVQNADEVDIRLSDRRVLKAKVVGTDPKTDVAVVKVEATGLTPAPWGDSDRMKVGAWVLAMGSPFGLDQTVTAGIISAMGRADVGLAEYEDFMQTDAAINPGNSGGPLVNMHGEVIGINTAIASRSGGFMGVGFAIPSNMARSVMQRIMKEGRVIRGWLGAAIQDLDADLAQSFGYEGQGVLIGDVIPNSPAAKGGLQSGDILVQFNGRPVTGANQLRNTVAETAPNTEVALQVFREGKTITLKIRLGELTDEAVAGATGGPDGESSSTELGLTARPLTPELAIQLGVESVEGVVVASVTPGGLAAGVGIRPGDVIAAIGSLAITSMADYREALSQVKLEQGIRIQLLREGTRRYAFLRSR